MEYGAAADPVRRCRICHLPCYYSPVHKRCESLAKEQAVREGVVKKPVTQLTKGKRRKS